MSAGIMAANKVLTFGLFGQERRSGSSSIEYRKSDHDLVVHSIVTLQWIPQCDNPGRTALAFTTLRNLATTIKTNFCMDTESAGGTFYTFAVDLSRTRQQKLILLQAIGQGNGLTVVAYIIAKAPAYDTLASQGHATTFKTAISGTDVS